jgi:hypothetical protein
MNLKNILDITYDEILSKIRNPRQRASLERIKQACDYLDHHGIKITPTSIEEYCRDHGWDGPKSQSIRNSRDVLMKYVDTRHSGQALHRPSSKGTPIEPAIDDESLRAYVQLLKQERDQAVAARARIEAGLRTIPGIKVDELIRAGLGGLNPAPDVSSSKAPPELLKVVSHLLAPERLAACGLELYKDRIRQCLTRNVLLERNEVLQLRLLISL